MPIKMIIDTDPGIDDAMAIFYAMGAPDIDLLGLTSIFGNVTVEQATRNALRLFEWGGVDAEVAPGLSTPRALPAFPPSAEVHGDEGFGRVAAATAKGKPLTETAPEYLVRMAREHKGELVLAPVGPLTNIAAAIDLDPDFTTNLKAMVIMGGSLRAGGNITPAAEANTYHDPHAAQVVFGAGGNIAMVGLDVTDRIQCARSEFHDLAKFSPKIGGLLSEMADFYIDFYEQIGKFYGCALHDPAAILACTNPELFTLEHVAVEVVCDGERVGETVESQDPARPKIDVCIDVDITAVKDKFFSVLRDLP